MGSNSLANYGQAREGAYFKTEQEADLQRYARRLAKGSQLQIMAGARLHPRREAVLTDSVRAFEVLPEIMQQAARISDPHAAARTDFIRRTKGMPTKLTESEILRYRTTVYGMAATMGRVPRMSFGRDRYGMGAALSQDVSKLHPPLSPAAAELGRRTYNAGLRALVYGSLLGAAAVAIGVSFAVKALDVNSMEEFRATMQGFGGQAAQRAQIRLIPLKARIQSFMGLKTDKEAAAYAADNGGQASNQRPDSELSRRLAGKYNTRAP